MNTKRFNTGKYPIAIILSMLRLTAYGCEACKKQQPKILAGITHGPGPNGNIDYIIVFIMVAITLYVLFYSVKYLVKPAEGSATHIKRMILNDEK